MTIDEIMRIKLRPIPSWKANWRRSDRSLLDALGASSVAHWRPHRTVAQGIDHVWLRTQRTYGLAAELESRVRLRLRSKTLHHSDELAGMTKNLQTALRETGQVGFEDTQQVHAIKSRKYQLGNRFLITTVLRQLTS